MGLAISNLIIDADGNNNALPGEAYPVQPASVQLALRLFISFVPAVILLLSFPIVYKYPITRQRHAEIRAELEARKGV